MDISGLALGVKLEMKKPHPCGGREWELAGKGAELKVKCLTCGRFVLLTPDEFKKRVRNITGVET